MQSHLKDLISRIRSHAKALAQQVEQADQQSAVLADTARQQSDAAQAMAAEVEQLSVAITEVAENAQQAREKGERCRSYRRRKRCCDSKI